MRELKIETNPKKSSKLALLNSRFVAKSRKSAELFACVRFNVRFYPIRVEKVLESGRDF
jgi:hypothetical protein